MGESSVKSPKSVCIGLQVARSYTLMGSGGHLNVTDTESAYLFITRNGVVAIGPHEALRGCKWL